MNTVQSFYDQLADAYHLIFEDWDRSIARQSAVLRDVLQQRRGSSDWTLLDAAVGIGTQALGLARCSYRVTGADISIRALARARREAGARNLSLSLVAADFRRLPFRSGSFGAVIACDNALPHLLSVGEIRNALEEMRRCAQPGGAVLLSMRDYALPPPPGTIEHRPYGEREWNGRRYVAEQEWRWNGPTYQLVMRIQSIDNADERIEVETTYLAVSVSTVLELMSEVGLQSVQRIDDVYYQPLLVGTVSRAA
jgi:ubiquinone/menaquinone biosynthesis C-methylase UbiE